MQTILTILASGFALTMIVSVLVVLTSARAAAVGDRMKAQADSLRPNELDDMILGAVAYEQRQNRLRQQADLEQWGL